MKKAGLYMALVVLMLSCSNGNKQPVNSDTSQKTVDTFQNRKDTRYYPDSTNQPHGPDKQ